MSRITSRIGWLFHSLSAVNIPVSLLIVVCIAIVGIVFYDDVFDWFDDPLEKRLEIAGENPSVLEKYARAAHIIGQYGFERKVLEELVRQCPEDTADLRQLVMLNIFDQEQIIKWAEMYVKVDSEDYEILTNLGGAYYGLGNYDAALKWYECAYSCDTSGWYAVCGIANSKAALGDSSVQWSQRCDEVRSKQMPRPAVVDIGKRYVHFGRVEDTEDVFCVSAPVSQFKRNGLWFIAKVFDLRLVDSSFEWSQTVSWYDSQDNTQAALLIRVIAGSNETYGYGLGVEVFLPGDKEPTRLSPLIRHICETFGNNI